MELLIIVSVAFIINNIFWMVFLVYMSMIVQGRKPHIPIASTIAEHVEKKKKERDPDNPDNWEPVTNTELRPGDILSKGKMVQQ